MLDFLNAQQCPPVGLHPSEVLCGDEPRVKLLSAVKASRHGKGNRRMPNRGRAKNGGRMLQSAYLLYISNEGDLVSLHYCLCTVCAFNTHTHIYIHIHMYVCQSLEVSSLSVIFLYHESLDDARLNSHSSTFSGEFPDCHVCIAHDVAGHTVYSLGN